MNIDCAKLYASVIDVGGISQNEYNMPMRLEAAINEWLRRHRKFSIRKIIYLREASGRAHTTVLILYEDTSAENTNMDELKAAARAVDV